jgi:hypothetical protein
MIGFGLRLGKMPPVVLSPGGASSALLLESFFGLMMEDNSYILLEN